MRAIQKQGRLQSCLWNVFVSQAQIYHFQPLSLVGSTNQKIYIIYTDSTTLTTILTVFLPVFSAVRELVNAGRAPVLAD